MRSSRRAVTFGSFVNDHALCHGGRALGVEVVSVDPTRLLPIPAATTWDPGDWLLFSEEGSLRRALDGEIDGRFLPRTFPLDLLDDKWRFAEWLASRPELTPAPRQWPLVAADDADLPFLIKARSSWRDGAKVPRGWLCRSRADLLDARRQIEVGDVPGDVYFVQEWLGDPVARGLSVCGFHDAGRPERNLVGVTERMASHRPGLSTAAAVRTVEDVWGLRPRAAAILDALGFVGPYELEFLVVHDEVRCLELNPRFWMQHSIFFESGNGVLRRYFEMDTSADHEGPTLSNAAWVDGLHLVRSLARGDRDFLRVARRLRSDPHLELVVWPPLPTAAFASLRWLARALAGRLRGLPGRGRSEQA